MGTYKEKYYKLKGVDDISQFLEDDSVALSTMKSSKFYSSFQTKIDEWEKYEAFFPSENGDRFHNLFPFLMLQVLVGDLRSGGVSAIGAAKVDIFGKHIHVRRRYCKATSIGACPLRISE